MATRTKKEESVKAEPVTEVSEVSELINDIISDQPEVKEEKPEEVKPEKPNLRKFLKELIEKNELTQKQILDKAHEAFPALLKSTISTILSDSKNKKYSKWEFVVKVDEKGIYKFSDEKVK